jgi:carboxyl-terminal processing protease
MCPPKPAFRVAPALSLAPSRQWLLLVAAVVSLTSAGCAIVDPNNIIGRQQRPVIATETPVPGGQSNAWRQQALDFVWSTIDERYYDPKLNGVDWKAVRGRYEVRILAAKTDQEYWELLDKMTGELKDSHTRVHSPKEVQQQRENQASGLGLGFLELDNALVVTSVHPESDAYWAGVRAGMTIKTIEGEPALPRYKKLIEESRESSTPWARTRGAQRRISSGEVDTTVNMSFARGDGGEISAKLKRRLVRSPPEFSHRVLPTGFGYVRFSGFVRGMQAPILAAIDKMKDTPGMIVDLRGNGGGSGEMSRALTAKFLTERHKVGRVITRDGKPISVFFFDVVKTEPEIVGNKATAYTKPLVILTNESSASASEIFASTLQDLGRATVIGRRTCGCLLGYLGYAEVPGGGALAYSEIGFVTQKGKRVEGEGVAPDIEVPLAVNDLVLSRDRALERAVQHLQTQTSAKVAERAVQ